MRIPWYLRRKPLFHCAYNLQEIASGTPIVNNFEMGAVGKSIATPTQGNSPVKKGQSSIIHSYSYNKEYIHQAVTQMCIMYKEFWEKYTLWWERQSIASTLLKPYKNPPIKHKTTLLNRIENTVHLKKKLLTSQL